MKKTLLLIGLIWAAGCHASLSYRAVPDEPLNMQTAVRAEGVLHPNEMYFTLLSSYGGEQARVIVLTDPAIKLADMTVSPSEIAVHYKEPHVPARLVQAWGKLAQDALLRPCPPRQIRAAAPAVNGIFELDVTGGVCL